jgi:diacylglycerol kinase family enzyme
VFVNRIAGRGSVEAYWHRLRDLFESLHISARFLETGSASELESASRHALVEGHRLLLAMGGDGTFQPWRTARLRVTPSSESSRLAAEMILQPLLGYREI